MVNIDSVTTVTMTGAEIKTAYETEVNAYTDTKDTKLLGIEASADANVGEEFTTVEQAKVATLSENMLPMEIYAEAPTTPVSGDLAIITGVFSRYDGSAWIAVKVVVKEV